MIEAHGARRREAGVSLIEAVIALFLASAVVLGLANGLLTTTVSTGSTNRIQLVGAAMTSYGEALKQLPYVDCATAERYENDYLAALAAVADPQERAARFGTSAMDRIEIVEVDYWRRGTYPADGTADQGEFVDTCAGGDQGAQRLTIQVTLADITRQANVVKRR